MFSGLLQEDLLKRVGNLAKSYFKQNYCHAFHTRFAVIFPLPSHYISSLFGEKLFQTKLLSRLSHKVCRHLSSPFPLHKFTIYLTETVLSITNNPFGFKVVHYCEHRLQISVIHFSVEGDTH